MATDWTHHMGILGVECPLQGGCPIFRGQVIHWDHRELSFIGRWSFIERLGNTVGPRRTVVLISGAFPHQRSLWHSSPGVKITPHAEA